MEIPVQTREGPSELKLRYMIYDIGSQNQYNNRIETYAPQTMVFVICYDITQPSSLENTLTWEMKIKEFTEKLAQSKGFTIPQTFVLVGTKRDLDPDKQYRGRRHHVTEKQLNEIFTESQFTNTIETSAKTGENVKELFERIGIIAFNNLIELNMLELQKDGVTSEDMKEIYHDQHGYYPVLNEVDI